MYLTKASEQWMTRPADERFSSLEALHGACSADKAVSREAKVITRALRAVADGSEIKIGNTNKSSATPMNLTHWSFDQLSKVAGAPAGYLRGLPTQLAAECINVGISQSELAHESAVLVRAPLSENENHEVGAILSTSYTRIWNADVIQRLVRLSEQGTWQPAPAAFDGSRGLYAGDRDMFAFLVDSERRIFEKDPNGGLSRGFFVWNSQVGAASFGMLTFLYEYVCGNHIVWGAKGVKELRLRHVGNVDHRAWGALAGELRRYAESSASDDEARIERTRSFQLGGTKDEVLDMVFKLRIPELTKAITVKAYDKAEERVDRYGSPRTAWGFANGLTELSQECKNAGDRVSMDRAAGKVLELAF